MGCCGCCSKTSDDEEEDATSNPGRRSTCRPLLCCCGNPVVPERRIKVTGCTYMDNGYLVIVDANNHRVKLFDPDLRCCSFVNLQYRPYCVGALGNELYVTLPQESAVQKLSVTYPFIFVKRKLRRKSYFKTESECLGIVSYKKDLIVSIRFSTQTATEVTEHAWQIQIMSTKGKIKRRFFNNADGSPLFHEAKYINITPDYKEIVFSETEDNRVKCLNIKSGQITFDYAMEDPRGVTCDKNNNIYVLGKHGSIRWILADRKYVKVLLDGIKKIRFSNTLTYNKQTHSLAVPRNENKIDLYKVKNSIHDY